MNRSIAALLLAIAVAVPALAERPKTTPANGFRAEFLANFDDVQSKIVSLAQAVPPKVYAWRPAKGVRSTSEVFMHVAGGNYFLATFLGVQPPKGTPQDLEKIIDKQKVLAELKRSFDHVR
ncbi:MAG: DinB family protein, partial [Thermoanaerobaculia bacterium]|nr:DinB family protein [Thermoanaerobaculia bacterium]